MNAPQAHVAREQGLVTDEGAATADSTRDLLRAFLAERLGRITRVRTVLPRATA